MLSLAFQPALKMKPVRTVLVLDEEPQLLQLLREILSREGFRVLVTRDSTEAARLCEDAEACVELLVLDAFTKEIGQLLSRRPALKVLALSSAARRTSGLDIPVVPKPFAPAPLLKAIYNLLA